MIVILKKGVDTQQKENLKDWLKSFNLKIDESSGESHTVLGLVGDTTVIDIDLLKNKLI